MLLALLASSQFDAFAQQASVPGPKMSGDPQELVGTLQKIVDDAIASKQGQKLSKQLESMRVPEYQTWFPATFGSDNGAKLAALYSESVPKKESLLVDYFVMHGELGGQIEARLTSGGPDQQKTEFQQTFDKAIRQSLKQPRVLYEVQYTGKSEKTGYPYAISFGSVTLVDGVYRLIDEHVLRALPDMPALRIRQGGAVTAKSLVNKVQPVYPVEARKQGLDGTVRLHAVLARDGSVKSLELVSGHPLLAQSALDAVRQWRYRPTTLNGEAVEVDTVIDVAFRVRY
jgi:TonB family protein